MRPDRGRPPRPRDPPHPRRLRLDGLVGGGAVRADRRRRSLRHPVRPARRGPLEHLPPRRPGVRDERPGHRRRRHPRRPRSRAGPRRRTLDVGRHGALPRPRPPRAGRVGDLHEHDDQRRRTSLPDSGVRGGDGRRGSRPVRHRGVRRVRDDDGHGLPRRVPPGRRGARPAPGPARRRPDPGPRGLADEPLRDGLRQPEGGGFGDVARPALVVHGALDPCFPVEHGEALRAAVPGATLVVLEDAGHELPVARWPEFVAALLAHTGPATQGVAR